MGTQVTAVFLLVNLVWEMGCTETVCACGRNPSGDALVCARSYSFSPYAMSPAPGWSRIACSNLGVDLGRVLLALTLHSPGSWILGSARGGGKIGTACRNRVAESSEGCVVVRPRPDLICTSFYFPLELLKLCELS